MAENPFPRSARWSLGGLAGGLILVVAAVVVLPGHKPEFSGPAIRLAQIVLIAACLIAAAGFLNLHRLRSLDARMGALVALAALVLFSLIPATAAIGRNRDMGAIIPAPLRPLPAGSGWTLAQYKCYEQSLNYYTHSRIVLIGFESELAMAHDQPDAAEWFPQDDDAIARLSARGPLALITWPELAPDIARKYHLTVWAEGYKRVTLVNDPGLKWLADHGAQPHQP